MDKKRVFSVYSEALDTPDQDRERLIEERCADDPAMAEEVRALLEAQGQMTFDAENPIDNLRHDYWVAVAGHDPESDEDLAGTRIDNWQLEARIGRGGLATVYQAERADGTFSQTAAFKVLRRGLDTDDVIARFSVEREILASLQHPGIASILDGGALPDGRPYLVLDYVDGEDLVTFAEANDLSVPERLGLINQVAAALNHAHQRLVVHRDIKPSNVMVTATGDVRLLDFGIARILDPSESPLATRLTRTGIRLLTPAYATPEQCQGLPVTTASDVYQLGLLMAELLTGARPITPGSTLTGTTGNTLMVQAAEPLLDKLDDRDLRAVIEKATRLEPEARYGSVRELADDLLRFAEHRPVLARAGSWRYRSIKFLRRRPLLVPVTGIVLVTAGLYVATITTYSRELERERTIAEQTQQFMIRLFESPDPGAPADPDRGRSITVVEALDIGRDRLLSELAGQPALDASLSGAISSVYRALDQFPPAIELRERALRLEEQIYGEQSHQALASMRTLTRLHLAVNNQERARSLAQRQLTIARGLADPGPELGLAEHLMAELALAEGASEQGGMLLEDSISDLLAQDDIAQLLDVDALMKLLEAAADGGDPAVQILATRQMAMDTLGAETPNALIIRSRAASSLYELGNIDAAEAEYLAVLPVMSRVLGKDDPNTLATRNNLAILYSGTGRYAEAEAEQRTLLTRRLRIFGPRSQAAAMGYQNLATVIARQGRFSEAIVLHQQAFDAYAEVFEPDHPATALPLISRAYAELGAGHPAAAKESAEAALSRIETDPRLAGISRCLIGTAAERLGDSDSQIVLEAARKALTGTAIPAAYAELCGLTD